MEKTMDKIVALAKARGFVYPGSEIYGGLANTWDYGNLGVELKNNVKRAWWQKFVQENPYNVGVDCAILMNPQTWVASGHLGSFSDPLMDCKECHYRHRRRHPTNPATLPPHQQTRRGRQGYHPALARKYELRGNRANHRHLHQECLRQIG